MEKLWQVQIERQTLNLDLFENIQQPVKQAQSQDTAKRFKWSTALDNLPTFHSKQSIGVDLLKIEWSRENILSVNRSSSGAQGVYFVTSRQGAVVIKPPVHSFTSELFSSLLSRYFGIATPKIRVIRTVSEVGGNVLGCLKHVDPTWTVIARLFDQVYLFEMEFIRGSVLPNFSCEELEMAFISNSGKLSQCGREFFYSLGRVMALDVFLNNADRLPLIWDNQGNAENLFVGIISPLNLKLINIDVQIRSISPLAFPDNYKRYFDSVTNLLDRLIDDKADDKFIHVLGMCSKWSHGCNFPEEECVKEMKHGFKQLVSLFKKKEDIIKYVDMILNFIGEIEPDNPQIIGFETINRQFISDMIELFNKYA